MIPNITASLCGMIPNVFHVFLPSAIRHVEAFFFQVVNSFKKAALAVRVTEG